MRTARLGDLVEIKGGGTPDKSVDEFWNGPIPWASVKDFKSTELSTTQDSITALGVKNSATNVIPAGAIIVPTRMAVGKAAINTVDMAINQDLKALIPRPIVDTRYLLNALLASSKTLEIQSSGATVKGITLDVLRSLEIPLPPLDEQRRIAAILDQADALRRKRREGLSLLSRFEAALFSEMFGDYRAALSPWNARSLGEAAQFYSGNSLPQGTPFKGQDGGFLLLKVSDLNALGNEREISTAAVWSKEPGSRAGTCPSGSIIFPKRGGAIATNKKRMLIRPAILDPNVMGVKPAEKIFDAEYLYSWFKNIDLVDISSGSTVPQLNKQDLAPLEVPAPPLELQLKFAARLKAVQANSARMLEALTRSERLFASLQHCAFNGEL